MLKLLEDTDLPLGLSPTHQSPVGAWTSPAETLSEDFVYLPLPCLGNKLCLPLYLGGSLQIYVGLFGTCESLSFLLLIGNMKSYLIR